MELVVRFWSCLFFIMNLKNIPSFSLFWCILCGTVSSGTVPWLLSGLSLPPFRPSHVSEQNRLDWSASRLSLFFALGSSRGQPSMVRSVHWTSCLWGFDRAFSWHCYGFINSCWVIDLYACFTRLSTSFDIRGQLSFSVSIRITMCLMHKWLSKLCLMNRFVWFHRYNW